MSDTTEIIKEARKAGMQVALLLFGCLIVVSSLFGYYIYKSYEQQPISMEAIQDGQNNNLEQVNGKAKN